MKNKVLAYGEVMMRLTPCSLENISCAKNIFSSYFGGSEANVLATLELLDTKTEFFTKFPNNYMGEDALNHLKNLNVGTKHIIMDGDVLGVYFTDDNKKSKHAKVIYNRKNAVVNTIQNSEFSFDTIFKDVSWFHVCGISLGISNNSKNLTKQLLMYAQNHNIKTSFDFNYREALWSKEEAKLAYKEIMPYVDVCFGNAFDIKTFLNINEQTDEDIIKKFFNVYNATYLVYTNREVLTKEQNTLQANICYVKNNQLVCDKTKKIEFLVVDRIGGGDAFDGGVINALNKDFLNTKEAINNGLYLDIIKHQNRGDVITLNKQQVKQEIKKLENI